MRAMAWGFAGVLLAATTGLADTFEDAQKAFKDKQYKNAIKLLDEHLKANKDDAKAYQLRGQARASAKQYAEAMTDFDKVIELDPKAAPAYFFRGKLHAQDKKTDKALADLDKAVELAPKQGLFVTERGNLHLNAGSADKALADFDQAVKLSPKAAPAYLGRAQATLAKNGQPVTFMRDGKVYTAIRWTADGVKKALPDLDKAIELNAKSVPALATRAECHGLLRADDKEVADRKQVVALNKGDANNLNMLAWILATSGDGKLRDGKAAVEYAKQAVELSKEAEGRYLDTLAAAHAEAGDFKKAVAAQEKAIELFKAKPGSVFHERLELYKKEKPFHIPAPKKGDEPKP